MGERISFDRIADVYDESRALPPRVLAKAVGQLAEELQGKRVLEIGVGTGRIAVPLQKSGVDLVGIDIAPRMVAHGLEKGLRNVVFADGARLPLRNQTFDAATTNHVLHLIADWRDVLQEIERVLRPDGFYFSVYERFTARTRLSDRYREIVRGLGWTHGVPGFHERDFPKVVPPARAKRVTHFEDRVPAERALDPLERRLYSFLWNVPDDLHARAIEALHREFDGTTIDRSFDLEIAYWTPALVDALARTP